MDKPVVKGLGDKILLLERMARRLEEKIANRDGSPGALEWDKSNLSALRAAVLCLRYHRSTIEDLGEPIEVLRRIVKAYEHSQDDRKLWAAVKDARVLLEEWAV